MLFNTIYHIDMFLIFTTSIYLVGAVRYGEGELVGVLFLLAGVSVLDAAGRQVGLRETVDSHACKTGKENGAAYSGWEKDSDAPFMWI